MSMSILLDREQEREAPPPHSYERRSVRPEPPRSRTPLWIAIAALTLGLGGVGWYAKSHMSGQDGLIGELKGWPAAVAAVRQQLTSTERLLAEVPKEIDALTGRVSDLDNKLTTGLAKTQQGTRDAAVSLRKEIASARTDARAQDQASEARIRELEAQQQAQVTRTVQLEREVANLNGKLAGMGRDLNSVSDASVRESAKLRQDIGRTSGRVEQVASFNNRARDRFEAVEGRTQEIAPGIMLNISRVDLSHRRFDGWLQLVNDSGRFLWLRDQSMLQTVAFYTGKNALRHDLVVTDLSAGGATGYLIFPRQGELQGAE